jgi:predicted PurR-regulated permease PerM
MEKFSRFVSNPVVKDGFSVVSGVIVLGAPLVSIAISNAINAKNLSNIDAQLTSIIQETNKREEKNQKKLEDLVEKKSNQLDKNVRESLDLRDRSISFDTKLQIQEHSNSERWLQVGMGIIIIGATSIINHFWK